MFSPLLSENTFHPFFRDLGNGAVLNTPQNIGTTDSYVIENIWSGKPSKNYDFNASFSIFRQKLNGTNLQSNTLKTILKGFSKIIYNFGFGKSSKVQVIANYTSAVTTLQGNLTPIYFIDLGYQQKVGKNARLGLTVVDILNRLQSGTRLNTDAFNLPKTSKLETRTILITFTYSFRTNVKDKMLKSKYS